ncbi:hypothetical protein PhCBS80983_g01407 [Powellomyces hirtus]|uniref:Peptidase M20 dimerisation domain-containing protein n=1 Tax=Powellomyces hirtus TaxID=109895 RepID=A0A507EAF9_9FUNG|nr:hypothetical protein PhCBS80983_g01407 [Powellomyces hirtus]
MQPTTKFRKSSPIPLLFILAPFLVVLVSYVLYHATTLPSIQLPEIIPAVPLHSVTSYVNYSLAELRLSEAVRIPTISKRFDEFTSDDLEHLKRFRGFLEREFPTVRNALNWEIVGGHSLLLSWKGSEGVDTNLPILFCAHQDVVGVDNPGDWDFPPFSGAIKGGFIHGRGTLDVKGMLISQLVAVEALLKAGYRPKRSFYLAFGHDEETIASEGSKALRNLFIERRLRFKFILDEGLPISNRMFPGIEAPLALIGVAEKGMMQLHIRARSSGGHGSMPFSDNAVHMLSKAVSRVADIKPKATLADGPIGDLLQSLAPEHPWLLARAVLGSSFLAEHLVRILPAKVSPGLAAMTRTTLATTQIRGGLGGNVLPNDATASVNCRIRPGETAEEVLHYVAKAIGALIVDADQRGSNDTAFSPLTIWYNCDGPRGCDPSPVSSSNTEAYRVLAGSIRHVYDNALVAPSLLMGATDAATYKVVSDNIYRFQPIRLWPQDVARIHGLNERIATKDLHDMIGFFITVILNADNM